MLTIAIFAAKGGAGKTTLAIHLAVGALRAGKRVAVFDADVQQHSAKQWGIVRRDDLGLEDPLVRAVDPKDVRDRQRELEGDGYELLVIDCPPRVDARSAAILAVADLVLVPVMPSAIDIAALDSTLPLIAASGKRAFLVLNGCPARAREVDEAAALLAAETIPLAPVRIGYRRAFSRSIGNGRTASETEPRGPAAAEITALVAFIYESVVNKSTSKKVNT